MSRYIDVDKLLQTLNKNKIPYNRKINYFITQAPIADVQKVRRGKWIERKGRAEATCSLCGRDVVYQIIDDRWQYENYCPHCGAKMEETDNE